VRPLLVASMSLDKIDERSQRRGQKCIGTSATLRGAVGARQAAIAIKLLFQDALGIDLGSLDLGLTYKECFRMSRTAAAGSHAAGTPGHAPGELAVVCLDNPRDDTRGKALWTSLPSLGSRRNAHGVCQMLYQHGWSVTL
jgi:hypothetical protein